MPFYPTPAHCVTPRQSVPESIDINTLKPNTSEITTGQVMELLSQKSIFPHAKGVIAQTYDSSTSVNGVQVVERPSFRPLRVVLARLFQRYGLPEWIRTDNGAPFASNALGRPSTLSVGGSLLGRK